MAGLKVFISSTCYDLHATRAQLRSMLSNMGYDPVMSDQADVLYDPRIHTHVSCLREVDNCDIVIVLVGSRFGGAVTPKAMEYIDIKRLPDLSRAEPLAEDRVVLSITQAEVIRAIQKSLPVFAFIDSSVMRDHLTYEKNKDKPIIGEIEFASIEKRETAAYIFEFINFLRLRKENNSIFEFSRFEDIEIQLKKQWSGLFQRLLHEQRERALETGRIDQLSGQIADLKAAVLGSISSNELKETAKGALRFRVLIELIAGLASRTSADLWALLQSSSRWRDLLQELEIIEVKSGDNKNGFSPFNSIFLRQDGTYFRVRLSMDGVNNLSMEWDEFQRLGSEMKNAIGNAVLDSRQGRPTSLARYFSEQFREDEATDTSDSLDEVVPPEQRILLTEEKFMEESIKNALNASPAFKNYKYMIDVKDRKVRVTALPSSMSGPGKSFEYTYTPTESGGLGVAIAAITRQMEGDIGNYSVDEQRPAKADSPPHII